MIRLHHVAQARSFRVLWLLEELGLEYDLVQHDFFDGSMRRPEFLALSPAGRVPALEIDGRVLFESGAITEYLIETRAEAGLGRLSGHAERPDFLEWLHYAETLGQHLANLTMHHVVLREPWMRSATVMRLEAKRLEKALEVVERVVAQRDYLLPSGFSAVDCSVGYSVMIARRFVPAELLPNVEAYYQRLAARPAFQAALEKDGPPQIYKKEFYEVPDS